MTLTGAIWRYIFSVEKYGNLRFDERLTYGEDTFFAQKVLIQNPICLHTDSVCYIYEENPNSSMSNRNFFVQANNMLRLAENHKKIIETGKYKTYKRNLDKWCARATSGYIYYNLRAGDHHDPYPLLREKGLWPYKKEWSLLMPRTRKNGGIKLTLSNYCLFFLRYPCIWKLFSNTNILKKLSK